MGNNASALPEKNSYAHCREHYADDYPVWTQDGFEIVKVNVDELFTSDSNKLKEVGDRIVQGLSKDNILILRNTPETYAKVVNGYKVAMEFLAMPEEHKKLVANPETVATKRTHHSGYSLIHFLNQSNRRDQEWRDVYQIRFSEEGHIPWPSDSFKTASQELYNSQWMICVQVLRAIALSLALDVNDLFKMVGSPESDTPDPYKSGNTNLCYFHYFDRFQSYKTPQKCMVHKDHGLLTILPKSDLPGLELLHPQLEQWIPMEQFIDNNEMLLYCGISLGMVTNSRVIPATHRVVRLPKLERHSMPFEMKPDEEASLRNLVDPSADTEVLTYADLSRRLTWEKVVTQVNRSDGIEPGSEEEKEWKARMQKLEEERGKAPQQANTVQQANSIEVR